MVPGIEKYCIYINIYMQYLSMVPGNKETAREGKKRHTPSQIVWGFLHHFQKMYNKKKRAHVRTIITLP